MVFRDDAAADARQDHCLYVDCQSPQLEHPEGQDADLDDRPKLPAVERSIHHLPHQIGGEPRTSAATPIKAKASA
jgi:hypothetical protein